MPNEDENYPEYQGHYDFEPRHDRDHPSPLHDNREEEEENHQGHLVEQEDPKICFVKAYARKPLGPPQRNVVPED